MSDIINCYIHIIHPLGQTFEVYDNAKNSSSILMVERPDNVTIESMLPLICQSAELNNGFLSIHKVAEQEINKVPSEVYVVFANKNNSVRNRVDLGESVGRWTDPMRMLPRLDPVGKAVVQLIQNAGVYTVSDYIKNKLEL